MKTKMSGTKLGAMKKSLGLKGKVKPGEMISRMNAKKGKVSKASKKVMKKSA